jgi:hypothetical protein
MQRVSRDYLFHRLVADISFHRQLSRQMNRALVYEIADRFTDIVCSAQCMVVQAEGTDGLHATAGKFGRDEPWPEWVNVSDLVREGLLRVEDATTSDGWTHSG